MDRLEALLSSLGLALTDAGGSLAVEGEDPIFGSRLRLGAAIGLPMMACAVGAGALWKMRTGERQDLELRLDQAIHGITPHYKFHPTLSGYIYPHPLIRDNPFLLENYQAADGRWVMACGVYPHLVAAWLRFLDCVPSPASVARAIGDWESGELESVAAREGLPCTVCRTPEEWLAHPQGQDHGSLVQERLAAKQQTHSSCCALSASAKESAVAAGNGFAIERHLSRSFTGSSDPGK